MTPSRSSVFQRLRLFLRAVVAWGGYAVVFTLIFASLLILAGRYMLMPEIAQQRHVIEKKLTEAIGLPVRIGNLTATWPTLHPRLEITDMQVQDRQGRVALSFDHVQAEVGWSSLWHFGLHLHRLEIVAPVLDIRRDSRGNLFIAGLPLNEEGDSRFADWLLSQDRIVVRDARITWHDEWRRVPELALKGVNFELTNGLLHHRFGLTAVPPEAVATKIDLRGDLVGRDTRDPASWHGEFYADLDQVDLSALAPWIDMPFKWQKGKGGLRLWMAFDALRPTRVTADVRMADVSLRLRRDLPELALRYFNGRVLGHQRGDSYSGEIKNLELATHDGIEILPLDARLDFNAGREPGGELRLSALNFGALAALAAHLPLPDGVHEKLRSFAPRGRLQDLVLSWKGLFDTPEHWRVKGKFADLALAPYRELPGFAGISGNFEGDEQSGMVRFASERASLELPAVFADPTLELTSLQADTGWRRQKDGIEFLLTRAAFRNADANGEASGSYRYTGQGLGEIDLSAKLTDAAGSAVWRYLPLVVNKEARDWLQTSITGGRADQATLRLKGPLDKFPFRNNQGGLFQVKGSFQGATLKYASSWPEITRIDGDLLFEGVRMLIRAKRADIMGVALTDVQAEIADLESMEELLAVSGKAKGATQRFLEFIEASPVGERIDHFTQAMQAQGSGELDLKLTLPLRRLDKTLVQGRFRFADNQVRVLPELPVLTQARGEFGFGADRLQAKNLRARLWGMPVSADVQSAPGGVVRVNLQGSLSAALLRQEIGQATLDHLTGETSWRGTITVKKPGAEIAIDSLLEGLGSSLPEPLNKPVRASLPLRVAGRIDPQRDEWSMTLGSQLAGRLVHQAGAWRGRVSLGTGTVAASLPPRGLALNLTQPVLDGDAWRGVLSRFGQNGDSSMQWLPLVAVDAKVGELAFLGRRFHDLQLNAQRGEAQWHLGLAGREAQGTLSWDGSGAGRLNGRMAHLVLPQQDKVAPAGGPGMTAGDAPREVATDSPRELPAIDLVIDSFTLSDMAFGEVRVNAENRGGAWEAKLDVRNEAARLNGEGRWRPSRTAPETRLSFRLDVTDAEKLLTRMGMPDAVRRGSAQLEGSLNWSGVPFGIDFPSLSGQLKVEAEKGQFKKLEPGVGRLLGVLSLQSLPRRITLDFRDIFSEGFAFDSIEGQASIQRGVARTDELRIRGPAAKILLSGQANLVAETQDLKVRVQPALGETIAVGAMIANPVAGAVAWAAQKVLNDPLDQVFAYEYAVTGGWSDPKVEKISRIPPPSTRAEP